MSGYKVFKVPFEIRLSGHVSVLGRNEGQATQNAMNMGFGVDKDNILMDGVLHDGSVHIDDFNFTDPQFGTPRLDPDAEVSEHNQYDPDIHGEAESAGGSR